MNPKKPAKKEATSAIILYFIKIGTKITPSFLIIYFII